MSPDNARKVIEDAGRMNPPLRALAVVASLATRVEPAFLRMLRLELVPFADAGTEADLWFSPLVGAWGAAGFVFETAVAALLRAELVSTGKLEDSWRILQQAHAGVTKATRRLDRLRYMGLRGAPEDQAEIDQTLGGIRSAIEEEKGHDLAQWIVQAFPSLPEPIRRTEEGALLALTAVTRVGGYPLELSGTFPSIPRRAFEIVPLGTGTQTLRLALDGGELAFVNEEAGTPALELAVPGGAYPVVEVRSAGWSWTGVARMDTRVPLPSEAREIEVESLGGTVWTLREAATLNRRKLFISHARGSVESAALESKLVDALTQAGHIVFRDANVPLGSDWVAEITQRLNECDDFIVLVSNPALTSEVVLEEVIHAFNRRRTGDAPRIWPVHVGHWLTLPYRWSAYLGAFQARVCRDDRDLQSIVRDIIELPPGFVAPEPEKTVSPTPPDQAPPEPSVDLAALTVPGGVLAPEDPFYIARGADTRVLAAADEGGETLVIKAPHQMGKSSLLKRYLLQCLQAGRKTALVDLSLFTDYELRDYTAFLSHLAAEVLSRLGLAEVEPRPISNQPDLTYFIQRQVLGAIEGPIVLAFDEVDRVLGQPYAAGFFSMLRYWHERRTDPGQELSGWPRLDLALVISTEPYLLIDDAMRSPFNVAAPIELSPFTPVECRELNDRYNRLLSDKDVDALYKLVGGQPYLTRLAYYHLGQGGTFQALGRNTPEGPFRDHLGSLLRRLTMNPRSRDLLAAMKQVIVGKDAPQDVFDRLAAAGLVRMAGGRMVPANELYHQFFRAVL